MRLQFLKRAHTYDVCIIGSGAGGGMAAKVLTEAGADVVMLEAGPQWSAQRDGDMFTWNYQSPRRGAAIPERHFGEFDACLGGWTLEGEPYTKYVDTEWDWFRARMLGGRTHHWGRISLRFGPDDFKGKSVDGYGDDWPISYDDIAPYYDKLDQLVGIFGTEEGIYNEPGSRYYQPAPRPRCYELLVKKAGDKMGIPVIPSRLSILTRPLNGRPACHYCSQCGRGCATHSNFSSPPVLIDPALQTGHLTLITNAMAREVLTNNEGLATGVSYVDTETLEERQVNAKIVVLAASSCESARLLLNSKSVRHPNGLANSSNVVGKYLMDSTGTDVVGIIPELLDRPPHNEDGTGGAHLYIPWWLQKKPEERDFPRGYHLELYGGLRMPAYGFMGGIHRYNALFGGDTGKGGGGYGEKLKQDYRRFYGATIGFAGRGEMLARKENYCEIDPVVVDKYGIPVLRFHVTWSDEELLQVKHMHETSREIISAMGGISMEAMPTRDQSYGILKPGRIIHEVGTTRMGDDPKTSVLNKYCQAHDAKNVFVADGGPFVSQAHKNCTWTILALAMRTAEYIAEERRKGNI